MTPNGLGMSHIMQWFVLIYLIIFLTCETYSQHCISSMMRSNLLIGLLRIPEDIPRPLIAHSAKSWLLLLRAIALPPHKKMCYQRPAKPNCHQLLYEVHLLTAHRGKTMPQQELKAIWSWFSNSRFNKVAYESMKNWCVRRIIAIELPLKFTLYYLLLFVSSFSNQNCV